MRIVYGLVFILMAITDDVGHAIAFDASGATTGAMTTPFIIALGLGVANLKGDYSEDNSFGLVGMASTGPILAGQLMSLASSSQELVIAVMDRGKSGADHECHERKNPKNQHSNSIYIATRL